MVKSDNNNGYFVGVTLKPRGLGPNQHPRLHNHMYHTATQSRTLCGVQSSAAATL
jgi:hypothetical protein